jgi:hypothetical protein
MHPQKKHIPPKAGVVSIGFMGRAHKIAYTYNPTPRGLNQSSIIRATPF